MVCKLWFCSGSSEPHDLNHSEWMHCEGSEYLPGQGGRVISEGADMIHKTTVLSPRNLNFCSTAQRATSNCTHFLAIVSKSVSRSFTAQVHQDAQIMVSTFTKEKLIAALQDQDCTEALLDLLNAAAKHPTRIKLSESDDDESSSDDGVIREMGIDDVLMTEAWVRDVRSAYKDYRDLDKAKLEGSTKKGQGQKDQRAPVTAPKRKYQTAIKSRTYEYDESEDSEVQEAAPKRTRQTARRSRPFGLGQQYIPRKSHTDMEEQNEREVQEVPPKRRKQTARRSRPLGVDKYRKT